MKELTDSIIKDLFSKTGVDEKYFPYYEEEYAKVYEAKYLAKQFPDELFDDDVKRYYQRYNGKL